MFWLYLIITFSLLAFYIYKLGVSTISNDDKFGAFWVILFVSAVWPVVLALAIVAGPFIGLFWLGDRKRRKKEQSAKNK